MNEIEKGSYKKNSIDSKNIFYISISVALIIIAFSFFYYNVIYKPQLDKSKIELQKIEQARKFELQRIEQDKRLELERINQENLEKNQSELDEELNVIEEEYTSCKKNAEDTYRLNWQRACKSRGLGEDGSLPNRIADGLHEYRQEILALCEREYKTKLETLKLKRK